MSIANIIESMRTNLMNAYESIEEKGATLPTEKNLANLAATIKTLPEGGNSGGNGDAVINGLVKDYYIYAGENINAGDFVQFAEGILGKVEIETTETATSPIFLSGDGEGGYPLYNSSWDLCPINFLPLTETKVFVGMATYSTRSVFVMQFNDDGTITMGPKTIVGQEDSTPEVLEKIADNMVFAYHSYPYGITNANVEDDYINIYRIDDLNIVKYVIKHEDEGDIGYYGTYQDLASYKLDDHHIILIGKMTSNDVAPTLVTLADDYSDLTWSRDIVTMNNVTLTKSSYDSYRHCYMMSNNRLLLITEGYSTADGFLFEVSVDKITYIKKFTNLPGSDGDKHEKIQLDDTHILFVYQNGNEYQVYGQIFTLDSDNSFTGGELIQLTSAEYIEQEDSEAQTFTYGYVSKFAASKNPLDGTILLTYVYNLSVYNNADNVYISNEAQAYHSIIQVNNDYTITILYENKETNLISEMTGYTAQRAMYTYFIGIPSSQNFVMVYDDVYDLEYPEECEEFDSKWQCYHINDDYSVEASYINGGTRLMYETQVKKATTFPIGGVAKTSGVGGDENGHKDQIQIYTLE